jgi:uncharacterized alkaline shock family protein YloU
MENDTNPVGNIYVSHRTIASIAYRSVQETYGVVGLAAKNFAEGIANVLVKDPTLGVEIQYSGREIEIDLFIIVEYGTRITTVANSVAANVRYQVEQLVGVPVKSVNVHVRGLRISNID